MADGSSYRVDFTDSTTAELMITPGGEVENTTWEVLPGRLPVGNHDHFVAETAGRLWIAGGLTHYRGYPAKLHVFDEMFFYTPGSGVWDSVPMPKQRAYNGLCAADGKVYVMGGSEPQDSAQSVRVPQPDFLIYDVETESWSTGPSLPVARMECTSTFVTGRVWVMCGSLLGDGDPTPPLDSLLSWAPGEASWRAEPPAPVPMRQFCSAVIGSVIYSCG